MMIDGVHFAEHVVLVTVGIDLSGKKHWGCAKGRPRTPPRARRCWPISSSAGFPPRATAVSFNGLSSTAGDNRCFVASVAAGYVLLDFARNLRKLAVANLPSSGIVDDAKAAIELYPVSGKKSAAAAQTAGLAPSSISTLVVEGDNRPGLGHAIAKAAGDAGINMSFVMAQVVGRKYSAVFGFENEVDASKAALR